MKLIIIIYTGLPLIQMNCEHKYKLLICENEEMEEKNT